MAHEYHRLPAHGEQITWDAPWQRLSERGLNHQYFEHLQPQSDHRTFPLRCE